MQKNTMSFLAYKKQNPAIYRDENDILYYTFIVLDLKLFSAKRKIGKEGG